MSTIETRKGRPPSASPNKVLRSLRLDPELVEYFERDGNFSAAINAALHAYIALEAMQGDAATAAAHERAQALRDAQREMRDMAAKLIASADALNIKD